MCSFVACCRECALILQISVSCVTSCMIDVVNLPCLVLLRYSMKFHRDETPSYFARERMGSQLLTMSFIAHSRVW